MVTGIAAARAPAALTAALVDLLAVASRQAAYPPAISTAKTARLPAAAYRESAIDAPMTLPAASDTQAAQQSLYCHEQSLRRRYDTPRRRVCHVTGVWRRCHCEPRGEEQSRATARDS